MCRMNKVINNKKKLKRHYPFNLIEHSAVDDEVERV
jgi:hypothetical protein